MYEYLKKLFGTKEDGTPVALTFEQLSEKLENSKNIKLANLSDGGYVSKEKYEAKDTELNGVKSQLEEANNTIQSYVDMDIEGIKKSAAEWEEKAKSANTELENKLTEQARAYSKELFFKEYKFSSKAAENGIRADFDSKDFKLEDGKFLGAKEYMDNLMQNDDYKAAFVIDTNKEPESIPNHPKWTDGKQNPPTPPKKKSLLELMKEKNNNPNADITFN